MSRPGDTREGPLWRRQAGAVLVTAAVVLPVLLLVMVGISELALLAFHQAQLRSAATAAALAIAAHQRHLPVPVATRYLYLPPAPFAVDGWIVSTLWLPDIDGRGQVSGTAARAAALTGSGITLAADVLPAPHLPAPFRWVRVTARAEAPGRLGRAITGQTLAHRACAIAWVRPDYWRHGWWELRTLESVFGEGDAPIRHSRLVSCGAGGVADVLAAVAGAHGAPAGETAGAGDLLRLYEQVMAGVQHEVAMAAAGRPLPGPGTGAGQYGRDQVLACIRLGVAACLERTETIQCPGSGHTVKVAAQAWHPGDPVPGREDWVRQHCPASGGEDSP